jgi:hypothetical protein
MAAIVDWATSVGTLLAPGILAMSIGLIRSETAGGLRILTATDASSQTRRSLTAATAGSLAVCLSQQRSSDDSPRGANLGASHDSSFSNRVTLSSSNRDDANPQRRRGY